MTYRWATPGEWLLEHAQELGSAGEVPALLCIINALATTVDSDTLQDLFQSDMERAGYFREVPR
jgi:hypothetical protein